MDAVRVLRQGVCQQLLQPVMAPKIQLSWMGVPKLSFQASIPDQEKLANKSELEYWRTVGDKALNQCEKYGKNTAVYDNHGVLRTVYTGPTNSYGNKMLQGMDIVFGRHQVALSLANKRTLEHQSRIRELTLQVQSLARVEVSLNVHSPEVDEVVAELRAQIAALTTQLQDAQVAYDALAASKPHNPYDTEGFLDTLTTDEDLLKTAFDPCNLTVTSPTHSRVSSPRSTLAEVISGSDPESTHPAYRTASLRSWGSDASSTLQTIHPVVIAASIPPRPISQPGLTRISMTQEYGAERKEFAVSDNDITPGLDQPYHASNESEEASAIISRLREELEGAKKLIADQADKMQKMSRQAQDMKAALSTREIETKILMKAQAELNAVTADAMEKMKAKMTDDVKQLAAEKKTVLVLQQQLAASKATLLNEQKTAKEFKRVVHTQLAHAQAQLRTSNVLLQVERVGKETLAHAFESVYAEKLGYEQAVMERDMLMAALGRALVDHTCKISALKAEHGSPTAQQQSQQHAPLPQVQHQTFIQPPSPPVLLLPPPQQQQLPTPHLPSLPQVQESGTRESQFSVSTLPVCKIKGGSRLSQDECSRLRLLMPKTDTPRLGPGLADRNLLNAVGVCPACRKFMHETKVACPAADHCTCKRRWQ